MQENKPLFSIAMTCYNNKNFLIDCIKSIQNQGYKNWEIIFVDDASTDGSIVGLRKLMRRLNIDSEKIKIFENEKNMGYGYSLGKAISESKGELVAIVDSDDALAHHEVLAQCVKSHGKHPEAAMTYSDYWECNGNLIRQKEFKTGQIPNGGPYPYPKKKIRVSHLKVLKKSFYDKTEGINPIVRQSVDKELSLRMSEVGPLIHIPRTLYCYRKHPANLTKSFHRKPKSYKKEINHMRKQIFDDSKQRRA